MADEILIATKIDVNYAQAEKEMIALQRKLDKATEKREITITLRDEASKQVDATYARLEKAKADLARMQYELSQMNGLNLVAARNRPAKEAEIAQQTMLVKQLQTEFDRSAKAVEKYDSALHKGSLEMDQMNTKMGQLKQQIATENAEGLNNVTEKARTTGAAISDAGRKTSTFGIRLKGLVKSAFVFNVISMALSAVRDWFGQVIQANGEAQSALASLRGALITMIQPIINGVMPALIKVFNLVARLAWAVAAFISALFGSSLQESASSAESMYASMGGVSDGISDANANAKKLKRTLAGFDELEILEAPEDASGGGGGGGGGGGIGDIPDFDIPFDLENSGLVRGLTKLGELLHPVVETAIDAFTGAIELIDAGITGLEGVIEGDAEKVKQSMIEIQQVIQDNKFWNWLWKIPWTVRTFFYDLAEDLRLAVLKAMRWIIDKFFPLFELLGYNFGQSKEEMLEGIDEQIKGIEDEKKAIEEINQAWKDYGDGKITFDELNAKMHELNKSIGNGEGASYKFKNSLERIDKMKFSLDNIKRGTSDSVNVMSVGWETIKGFMSTIPSWFENTILTPLIDGWNSTTSAIGGFFSGLWTGIQNIWSTVAGWFQNSVINPVVNAWNVATTAIGNFFTNVFNGIRTVVANALNGVISGLESAINWCVDAINGLIGGINSVVGSISKVFKISYPGIGTLSHVYLGRVPALAEGGVVPPNREFLAMLGDNQRETEVVSPLSTMKQAMIDAMREAGFSGNITVNSYLDGRKIASNTTKYQAQARRAMGT